jgi:D-glycero-alpha-D-manno-heptose 1-phosphate guanylyltransferase
MGRREASSGRNRLPAIILAGGQGTRLKSFLPGCPKPLIPINGRPFLEFLVDHLLDQGIEQIFLATGYRGDQIAEAFAARSSIHCVCEQVVLGTGGAVANVALQAGLYGRFLVLNGDSFTPFKVAELSAAVERGAEAAMLGTRVADARRYGSLSLDAHRFLKGFREKSPEASDAVVNAGVYLLHHGLLPTVRPVRPASIELDYFPRWLRRGTRIAVVESVAPFIDVGTPESLLQAGRFFEALEGARS